MRAAQHDRRTNRRRRPDARGDRADRPRGPRAADGTGYPDGLRLDEIPICARIIAVVDAYDAMTSDRPYRQAMSSTTRSPSSTATPARSSTRASSTRVVVALTSRQPLALAA